MWSDPERRVTEFLDVVLSRGDLGRLSDFVASTFVDHHPWPGHTGTRAGFESGLSEFRAAFPDARFAMARIDVDGDIVSALVTRTGTHLGPLRGVGPSGARLRIQVLEMLRIEGGRIVERWGFLDEDVAAHVHPLSLPNAVVADRRLFMG
jgi:predicted ester cyclase